MKNLMVFSYEETEVRMVRIGVEPWWVLKDVCDVLELSSPHKVASRLDDDERSLIPLVDSIGKRQEMAIINESGLYSVILRSDKPEAKKFRKWITNEILPSIRRTGSYSVKPSTPSRSDTLRLNALTRQAALLYKMSNVQTLSTEYQNILLCKATEILTGENLLPLPKSAAKTLSATEVGKELDISAKQVGALANTYNLKTDEYGEFYRDKSRYSGKEVDTFRYYPNVIPRLREILQYN